MCRDQEVIVPNGTAETLEFSADFPIVPIGGFVQRNDVDGRQHSLELARKPPRTAAGGSVAQFGGHYDADRHRFLLDLNRALRDPASRQPHEIGNRVRV